jgi:CheY-like chemotaxis protein
MGSPIERFIPERFRHGHGEHIARFRAVGVTKRRRGALGAVSGLRANGEEFPVEASISLVTIGGEQLSTVILRDITERKANEEARLLLAREVDHRAKNALAVVQAVVSLTRASTKEEFIAAVRGRVLALGRAHSLLAQNRWEGGDLAQIVADETAGYQRDGQITISGPRVRLPPNAVQPLSLMRLVATLPASTYWTSVLEAPSAASGGAAGELSRRGRVLVVEDEALIALAISQDLASLGWDIVGPAATVAEAQALVRGAALPDAAVLDVNLSGELVYPLAEWLQSQHVPLVFCSGYEQLDGDASFGVWPHVKKPVDVRLLDRELRRARRAA